MFKETLITAKWVIIPEKRYPSTKKKPNLKVKKSIFNTGQTIEVRIYLCMDLKKEGGYRIKDALAQIMESNMENVGFKGNNNTNLIYMQSCKLV